MARSAKARKQRVALRFKRREQLKSHARTVAVRSIAAALIIGFGVGLVAGGDSFLSRFLHRHTPRLDIQSAQVLAGIPVASRLPEVRFWLWLPGSGFWLEKRICQTFRAVRSVRLERNFESNQIVIHVEARVPLVIWNDAGFDKDGRTFPVTPGTWGVLPKANFPPNANKQDLSRWLARLSLIPEVWSQVSAVHQDPAGMMDLTLKTGAVVDWGPAESEPLARKAQLLARVLDDAHKNLGGAARADLRFFEQGRIIVLPKGK